MTAKEAVDEATEKASITQFPTGAIRDKQDGKLDFVETHSELADFRFTRYMTEKKKKYGAGNFKKGIPIESYIQSATRHWKKFLALQECQLLGIVPPDDLEPHEDHLAAMRFNIDGIMHEQEKQYIKLDAGEH